jgi:hypothetical protein
MSRFTEMVVAAVGSHGLMVNPEARPGRPPTVHIQGNSFNAVVRATNFFNSTTNVGCHWTDISSPLTAAGMYNLPDWGYKATLIQVNSMVGSLSLALG